MIGLVLKFVLSFHIYRQLKRLEIVDVCVELGNIHKDAVSEVGDTSSRVAKKILRDAKFCRAFSTEKSGLYANIRSHMKLGSNII